jgi:tRNA(fMet)-specific endonuclease VapC
MPYLLDTNIIIGLLKKQGFVNSILRTKQPDKLFISGTTIGEIYYGIEKSSPVHKQKNLIAREAIMSFFKHDFIDTSVCEEYGKIKAELFSSKSYSPNNENDIWIAAHARARSFILVTENLKDFDSIPRLTIESWSVSPPKSIQT